MNTAFSNPRGNLLKRSAAVTLIASALFLTPFSVSLKIYFIHADNGKSPEAPLAQN